MTDLFGAYKSQTTRELSRIDSSKYPDTNKDFEENVRRLNEWVDYISQYLQQMQKGVDQANKDPITSIRDMISNFAVLFGGGELLYGINLGDLKYFIPAIGALLGFDSNQPFPLNLFSAAEHFFLGYIVPLDSFASVISDMISGLLNFLGVDPQYIQYVNDIFDAFTALGIDFTDFMGTFSMAALQRLTDDVSGLFTTVINSVLGLITHAPEIIISIINTIIAWFAALPDLFFTTVETLLGWVTDDTTGGLATGIIDSVMGWITSLPALAESVVNGVLLWIENIPALAVAVINGILGWITAIPTLITTLIDTILGWVTDSETLIIQIINTALAWITSLPSVINDVITSVLSWLTDDSTGLFATVMNTILDLVTTAPALITSIINSFLDWLESIPTLIFQVISTAIGWITNDLNGLATTLVNAAIGWISDVELLATAVVNAAIQWVTAIPELITTVINSLLDWVTEFPDLIISVINSVTNWITNDLTGLLANTVITSALDWVTAAPDLIEQVINTIMDWVTNAPILIEQVVNGFLDWISQAPALIEAFINALLGWVEAAPALAGAILNAVVTLITRAPEIAQALVRAMMTLITNAPTLIFDVINVLLTWLDDITGLNLASWSGMLTGLFGGGTGFSGILGAFTNSILGFGSNVHSTIPILGSGQVNNSPQNLLIDGLFGSVNSFDQVGGWVYDATKTVTGAIGSALATVGAGVQTFLGSVLHVLPGDTVSVSSQVAWSGLNTSNSGTAGTGVLSAPPLTASVNFYGANNNLLATTPLAAAGGVAGSPAIPSSFGGFGFSRPVSSLSHETDEWADISLDHVESRMVDHQRGFRGPFGLDADDDFVPLEGSTIVPDVIGGVLPVTVPATIGGVVPVKATIMMTISDEVDAGSVWVTKGSVTKMQLIRQELIHNLPADKQAIIESAAGVSGATVADIVTRLGGINPATGAVDWNYVPDLRNLNDTVVTQLNGWEGTGFGHDDSVTALGGTKSALVAASSTLSVMTSRLTKLETDVAALAPPAASKIYVVDTFQRVSATSLGSNWDQSYSGSGTHLLATSDGENAYMVPSGGLGDRYCLAKRVGTQSTTATDYQVQQLVLSASPTSSPGGSVYGYIDLAGRMNSAKTDYLLFRYQAGGQWVLYYVIGSIAYSVGSGFYRAPTTLEMRCGTPGVNQYGIKCSLDNNLMFDGTVSASASDASHRGFGLGYGSMMDADGILRTGGKVNTFTAQDA